MEWIDTHTHLYLDAFRSDGPEVIERARQAGVTGLFLPSIDRSVVADMLALEEGYPGLCHAMMGLHPCSVHPDTCLVELAEVERWLQERPFIGVGEIGLDFHWDTTHVKEQFEAFRTQVEWAKSYGLPVAIHSRKSTDECISVVREAQDGRLTGVFHCFTGTVEQARQVTELGLMIGIGGVVTYKNGGLEPVIREIGLNHIVLETDAPYLAPVPHRGKRNEPAHLLHVAQRVAELAETDMETVARVTTANARRLFPRLQGGLGVDNIRPPLS
jgi:TatD DNase family protein